MLAVGDVYEVVVTQNYLGSTLLNVLHFVCDLAITSPQSKFQVIADDIKEMQRPNQSNLVTYTTWKATQVAGAGITYSTTTCRRSGGDVYEGNHSGTLIGGSSTTPGSASFNAMVSALKSGLAGRSRRGSMYMGGLAVQSYDTTNEDHFTSAFISSNVTTQAVFFAKYNDATGTDPNFSWVIWSKFIASGCKYVPGLPKPVYTHVQPGDQPNSAVPVVSVTPRPLVVPMRRRKEGRGI